MMMVVMMVVVVVMMVEKLIAQLDNLWYWYLDFYVDYLYFDTQMTEKHSTAMC